MARPSKGARRKNVRIDQKKLDAAKKILGTKTETETIERALDDVLFTHELLAGLERVGGKYPDWPDPYGEDQVAIEFRRGEWPEK